MMVVCIYAETAALLEAPVSCMQFSVLETLGIKLLPLAHGTSLLGIVK